MNGESKEATKSKRKRRWVITSVSLFTIFVLWQPPPKPRTVPDELVGTWRSSDPGYADRFFEIGVVTINMGTGPGTVSTGFIQRVEAVPDGNRKLYTIFYVDDGKEEQCSFYYTSAKEKTIYFKNQPTIPWIKDNDS